MKKLSKFLLCAVLITCAVPTILSDDGKDIGGSETTKVKSLSRSSSASTGRPAAPSMQEVSCTLSEDGLLTLSFLIDEGMAELTLDDGTEVFTDHFDTAAPYVTTVSDPTATIALTVTTDKGNTYEGEI